MTDPILPADPPRELLSLTTARVRDAALRAPHFVDGGADLVSVCRELHDRGLTQALVRDGARLGMFTTTDLRDALLRPEPPGQIAVREVARFELVTVDADADLAEAMWQMVRHRVHRLVVRDGAGAVLGVLGQLDVVGVVARHSHVVAQQIDDAGDLAALRAAAGRVDETVRMLHASGLPIGRLAQLVTVLHARLFARLWAQVAPAEVVAGSCLLVMGSEGRGEQLVKTDQDNALLLHDGFVHAETEPSCARFSAALGELGWPPCPGDVMVTNPLWRQPLAAFAATMRGWVYGGRAEGPLALSIFVDATAVAGDAALLAAARDALDALLGETGQDLYLRRLAAAADQFAEPGNWLTRLTTLHDDDPVDLKKLGVFPIVHGVRALALQQRLRETGTVERLQALHAAGVVDADTARDLRQALHHLMAVRTAQQLQPHAAGTVPGNTVRPDALSTLERETLRDALAIVRGFRRFLRLHFHLEG